MLRHFFITLVKPMSLLRCLRLSICVFLWTTSVVISGGKYKRGKPLKIDASVLAMLQRKQAVKDNILKQLYLTDRPPKRNTIKPVVIPLPIKQQMHKVGDLPLTTRAILMPKTQASDNKQLKFTFEWRGSSFKQKRIHRATLSIYKLPKSQKVPVAINNYEIDELTTSQPSKEQHQVENIYKGWMNFDITQTVVNKHKQGEAGKNHLSFTIKCNNCKENDALQISDAPEYAPYIALEISHRNDERIRRSTNECKSRNSSCCLRRYHINFKDIHWDDWVLAPTGFSANYCHGSCKKEHSKQIKHVHTSIMNMMKDKPQWHMSTCCVATRYSVQNLLYIDEDDMLYMKEILDMAVEECACA